MATSFSQKSSIDEIRERFDGDVERFSNLETGQQAIIDARLAMDLITRAAFAVTPRIRRVLDIGCGAGNNTLKLLQLAPGFASDLLDLSAAMLERARERAPGGSVWITDMVLHEIPGVHELMWQRYGFYLTELGGAEYRDKIFTYIEKEDSPRPLTYQLDLLRRVGFTGVDVLHKNSSFAAFGGVKK